MVTWKNHNAIDQCSLKEFSGQNGFLNKIDAMKLY